MKDAFTVGLTGQTGAGKSTVARIFAQAGFEVIDADEVSRFVMMPGTPCLASLSAFFGEKILRPDGSLDRPALAGIVFTDRESLAKMDSICYPFILEEIQKRRETLARGGHRYLLLDAPTLFESGAAAFCDRIISVLADASIRRARIMARDGLTGEQADNRMNSQLPEEYFRAHSDVLLHNNADKETLRRAAEDVAEKLKKEAKKSNAATK